MTILLALVLLTRPAAAPGPTPRTVGAILACAGEAERCQASDWDLAHELVDRAKTPWLLGHFARESGARQRVLAFALTLRPEAPGVRAALRSAAASTDDAVREAALKALARSCDGAALEQLARPPYTPRAACLAWSEVLAQLGTCGYRPATPLLVASLDCACGNEQLAAEKSLRALYPNAPAAFGARSDEARYFLRRFHRER